MKAPLTIVMIEDDEGHARLIERNIRRAGVKNDIVHCSDGASSYTYFNGLRNQKAGAAPILVLLDLNLPDVSGLDILEYLKNDGHLKVAPVIVLTTADDQAEIQRCYDRGCNVYITKPVDYGEFATAIRQLGQLVSVIKVPDPL